MNCEFSQQEKDWDWGSKKRLFDMLKNHSVVVDDFPTIRAAKQIPLGLMKMDLLIQLKKLTEHQLGLSRSGA